MRDQSAGVSEMGVENDAKSTATFADCFAKLSSLGQVRPMSRGQLLFLQGHRAQGAFLITEGRARVTIETADGRQALLWVATNHVALGLAATLIGGDYLHTAEVQESGQYSFLSYKTLQSLMSTHRNTILVTYVLVGELRASYRHAAEKPLAERANARVARFLLGRADGGDSLVASRIRLGMTHEEIGFLTGLSRETISRVLGAFRRAGLIHTNRSFLTIVSPDELHAIVEGNGNAHIAAAHVVLGVKKLRLASTGQKV